MVLELFHDVSPGWQFSCRFASLLDTYILYVPPRSFNLWSADDRTEAHEKADGGSLTCRMRGRLLPAPSAGEWKPAVEKIGKKQASTALGCTVDLNGTERSEVVSEFARLPTRVWPTMRSTFIISGSGE